MTITVNTINKFWSWCFTNNVVSQNLLGNVVTGSFNQTRQGSWRRLQMFALGEPTKVLDLIEYPLQAPPKYQVTLKLLYAPINADDVDIVRGNCPYELDVPGTPGTAGVGEVIAVGPNVGSLKVGDKVIVNTFFTYSGTWRNYGNFMEKNLFKIPNDINLVQTSVLTSNACAAYRILRDFVKLNNGDTVLLNGARTNIAQNVIMMSKNMGLKVIALLGDDNKKDDRIKYLKGLGAEHVLTEEEFNKSQYFYGENNLQKPRLVLIGSPGPGNVEIIKKIDENGVVVVFGAGKNPTHIPTKDFIYHSLTCKSFWMAKWHEQNHNNDEQKKMFSDIITMIKDKKLTPPRHKLVPLTKYKEAFDGPTPGNKDGFKLFLDLQK